MSRSDSSSGGNPASNDATESAPGRPDAGFPVPEPDISAVSNVGGSVSCQRQSASARSISRRSVAWPRPATVGYTGVSRSGSGVSSLTIR